MRHLPHSGEVQPRTEASPKSSTRRGFLFALSAGGVGAAAAAVQTLAAPVAAVTPQVAQPVDSNGYRETVHVRQYYAKARI